MFALKCKLHLNHQHFLSSCLSLLNSFKQPRILTDSDQSLAAHERGQSGSKNQRQKTFPLKKNFTTSSNIVLDKFLPTFLIFLVAKPDKKLLNPRLGQTKAWLPWHSNCISCDKHNCANFRGPRLLMPFLSTTKLRWLAKFASRPSSEESTYSCTKKRLVILG